MTNNFDRIPFRFSMRRVCCRLVCLGLVAVAPVAAQSDYSTPYVFSTLAGVSSIGSADGTGQTARFYGPNGVAVDAAGNVFVTDMGNHTIRKITPDGVVTTLAGEPGVTGSANGTGRAARFNFPEGIAIDREGNLYVADSANHAIRKVTPGGAVTTLAGRAGEAGSEDGSAEAARFNLPTGVAVNAEGTVFVADTQNHVVRQILPSGLVSTLAGVAGMAGDADGAGSAARLNQPDVIAVDPAGNIHTNGRGPQIDARNTRGWIRRITPAGVVTTVGSYTYTFPLWSEVHGMAFDAAGNRYESTGDRVRRVAPDGTTTTVAGDDVIYLTQFRYVDGPADIARFRRPHGIFVSANGSITIADGNNVIRRYTPSVPGQLPVGGFVDTLAGLAVPEASARVDGVGDQARFTSSGRMMISPEGGLLVIDDYSNITGTPILTAVRRVATDGTVTTTGLDIAIVQPTTRDAVGNVYEISEQAIGKITPGGEVTILAGGPGILGAADGVGAAARFNRATDIAVDATGNVFVADYGNHTIRMVTPAGVVSTIGGLAGSPGSADGTGAKARFNQPRGISVDADGTLYVSSSTTVRVGRRAVAPVITREPVGRTVDAGTTVSFVAAATGTPGPSYQWYLNGDVLAGGTRSTLTVVAGAQTAGEYTVAAINDVGHSISQPARLSVNPTPPPPPPSGGSSGGGGGGAPSVCFLVLLATLAALRRANRK